MGVDFDKYTSYLPLFKKCLKLGLLEINPPLPILLSSAGSKTIYLLAKKFSFPIPIIMQLFGCEYKLWAEERRNTE